MNQQLSAEQIAAIKKAKKTFDIIQKELSDVGLQLTKFEHPKAVYISVIPGNLSDVMSHINDFFGDDIETKGNAWLNRPSPALNGRLPIEVMNTEEGCALVLAQLEKIKKEIEGK